MDEQDDKRLAPRSFALIAVILASALVAVGFVIAVLSEDEEWAARFGCLTVLFGLLTLVVFQKRFGFLQLSDEAAFDAATKRAVQRTSDSSFDAGAQALWEEMNKYGQVHRNKWLFLTEVGIIGLGTFVWGFGDIFAEYAIDVIARQK